MNLQNFHMGGLVKVTLFFFNYLRKTFLNIFHFAY